MHQSLGSIRSALYRVQIAFIVLVLASCVSSPSVDSDAISNADILNLAAQERNILTSGQPTQEQLQVLANSGVKHIVNLRPVAEQEWDEAAYVESLGMQYHSIPVAGAAGVSVANAQSLDELLNSLNGQPLLVHCASSNRVGALRALAASINEGAPLESAIATGKDWGLRSLEPVVRGIIGE
ncbi:MAG: sulfur transferase domain-containing protein [Pseudohongiellaceae bacterium]|nr:sulfur transferase domain-containing protein [Pseudohongiellaceae bacterium]